MTELWLALDVADTKTAVTIVKELKEYIDVFKIGLELYTSEGPKIIEEIKNHDAKIFLDLKFCDIPNTVAGAVRSASKYGVDYMDVHACGGPEMMKAAIDSANEESVKCQHNHRPKILAITVLTSINSDTLNSLKINNSVQDLSTEWALLAKNCGLDGIVSSVHELKNIKEKCGENFLTITPGIRVISNNNSDDQKRIGTPEFAKSSGSSAIVVGRPILNATNRKEAAFNIQKRLGNL